MTVTNNSAIKYSIVVQQRPTLRKLLKITKALMQIQHQLNRRKIITMNRLRKHLNNLMNDDSIWLTTIIGYFKIFGLAPITLKLLKQENNSSKRTRWTLISCNRFGNLYSCLVFTLLASWNLLTFFKFMKRVYVNDAIINTSANVFEILSSLCVVAMFGIRKNSGIRVFNQLDSIMQLIDCHSSLSSYTVIIVLFINLLIFVGIVCTLFFYELVNSMIYSGTLLCHLVLNATMMQYFVVLKLIERLFELINNELTAIFVESNVSWEPIALIEMNAKLLNLWKAHSMLSLVSKDISSLYSLPALLVTSTEFLSMTVFAYFIAKPFFIGGNYLSCNDYVNWILFTLINLLIFIHLTLAVTATINESKNTRVIVNDLLQKPQMQMVKDKLNQFSIYLLQDNVNFTVFDLFSLDSSLLVKIAGSITTYMVILLQFKSRVCAH